MIEYLTYYFTYKTKYQSIICPNTIKVIFQSRLIRNCLKLYHALQFKGFYNGACTHIFIPKCLSRSYSQKISSTLEYNKESFDLMCMQCTELVGKEENKIPRTKIHSPRSNSEVQSPKREL